MKRILLGIIPGQVHPSLESGGLKGWRVGALQGVQRAEEYLYTLSWTVARAAFTDLNKGHDGARLSRLVCTDHHPEQLHARRTEPARTQRMEKRPYPQHAGCPERLLWGSSFRGDGCLLSQTNSGPLYSSVPGECSSSEQQRGTRSSPPLQAFYHVRVWAPFLTS